MYVQLYGFSTFALFFFLNFKFAVTVTVTVTVIMMVIANLEIYFSIKPGK